METTQSIRNSLQVGQWTTSLDLKDAYFHIPMAPSVHKLLRFQVLGKLYQFVAMSFGLATAPWEFTTLVKEVKMMALRLGISVHMYLDDWLIKANSCQEAHSATVTLLELTHKLGWIVNRDQICFQSKFSPSWARFSTCPRGFVIQQMPGSCPFRRLFILCFSTPILLHARLCTFWVY